ncbi:MAG: M20/M25/M40 family metallo-hydrolase [Phycisphaerales bacterium]
MNAPTLRRSWPIVPSLLAVIAGCAIASAPPAARALTPTPLAAQLPSLALVSAAMATLDDEGVPKTGYAVIKGEKAPVPDVQMGDPAVVARIVDEGKNRNKVMEHLTHISDEIGPRLTGSTALENFENWAKAQFDGWGLKTEMWKWGDFPVRFDRGPSSGKVVMRGAAGSEWRTVRELQFTTSAWTAGTEGAVRGPVVKMPENEEQFEAVKDKLKGAWLLIKPTASGGRRGVMAGGGPAGRQRTFANIRAKWAGKPIAGDDTPAPEPFAKDGVSGAYEGTASGGRFAGAEGVPVTIELWVGQEGTARGTLALGTFRAGRFNGGTYDRSTGELTFTIEGGRGAAPYTVKVKDGVLSGQSNPEEGEPVKVSAKVQDPEKAQEAEAAKGPSLEERILKAGPAGFISASNDDRVRTGGSYRGIDGASPPVDAEVMVRQADYDYINSRVADGLPIQVEFDLPHTFKAGPIPVHNVIAEIPGTVWPDEVVIISAHMDSWNGPGSQGTTDNGTGTSVTMEAARILMAAGAKPKRTIRFILWSGEEQGLLGSREYVKVLKEKGELEKISACFVDDGGTNYEGGLQCLDSQVSILAAATAPVNGVFYSETDKKHLDVNIRPSARAGGGMAGGSSDHASFQREGVPGFFWDEVGRADYQFGWHTQNDKLNLAIPEYLMQSSTCAAVTAYNLACAPSLLPRKPLPKEEEPKKDGAAEAVGAVGAGR